MYNFIVEYVFRRKCLHSVAVVVLVRDQGVSRTGERYQLTCTVTKSDSNVPVILWRNSNGMTISNGSGISVGPVLSNGTFSTSLVILNPLSRTHEGNYTCQATVGAVIYSYTFPVTVTTSESITDTI